MQVLGTVISVAVETDVKKNGGGSYKGWELIYKSDGGDVRTIAKPIQGLRFNAPLKKVLEELAGGDQFTLVQEKNDAGFYDVKSITKGWAEGTPSLPASPSQTKGSATSGNAYAARDYEGKEERTARQRLIVRQSSLSAAVAILTVGAKAVDKEAVKALADELTDFVFEQKRGTEAIAELAEDVPY